MQTLSVIVTNYNQGQYLPGALDAIVQQSLTPLEVIVVDDGSTDGSRNIIGRYAMQHPLIRVVQNERNRGMVFAANRALERARGDYLYWAAADDRVLPGFFEQSMALLAQHPQAGLCCSDPAQFDSAPAVIQDNRLHLSDRPAYFSPGDLVERMQRQLFPIAGHTSVVKRAALLEAGGLIPELQWHCDWFALLVIAFRYGLCYVPAPLAAIRISPHSYSASGTRQWSAQRVVLGHLFRVLRSPAYRDVLRPFQRSGVMAHFGWSLLRLLLSHPQHWRPDAIRLMWRPLRREVQGRIAAMTASPWQYIHRQLHRLHGAPAPSRCA